MALSTTQLGRGVAKGLGIKLEQHHPDPVTRGESVFSVTTADSFLEPEPTTAEWIRDVTPTPREIGLYFYNLFPFLRWIGRYNVQWLIGDLVAGITVGAVVVPQSMAYAKLANLPVQFGLYSSFMGVLIYWFFATSKDITIGPVAVMSTITGNIVAHAAKIDKSIPGHVVASALAIILGAITCGLGLLKLGWLTEFISLASITAFMTGSAINIAVGQVPSLMGLTQVNSRGPTYLVVIHTLRNLGHTKIDAAMGLTALFLLYLIRFSCNQLAKRFPNRKKLFFFISTLRTAFVILLYTMISWLVNRHVRNLHKPPSGYKAAHFAILGPVPRGFQDAAVPQIDKQIISLFTSSIPVGVIVLLIEHISISKSFGRVNNYVIDPSQELVAIGVSNLLGPFLGAYPATGSFSRTAIKSKAGVRTPLAGVITAVVVLLAIYALPAVFFYIPNASLSAVIIHAVGDLITPPNTLYQFWRVSPIEVFIYFAGVFVTIFTTIDYGVYVTICSSAALFLYHAFKAQGRFLGRVKVHSVIGDHLLDGASDGTRSPPSSSVGKEDFRQSEKLDDVDADPAAARTIFLPLDHADGSNPCITPAGPHPGVFIYRFSEGYNYPNASRYLEHMVQSIFAQTRRTNPHAYKRPGDRPWNDPGPRRKRRQAKNSSSSSTAVDAQEEADAEAVDTRPLLKAVILDFSAVNHVDITSVQNLIDVRNQLDAYAAPTRVQWHFACVRNRWTKRALAAAGFGFPSSSSGVDPREEGFVRWKPMYSVAEIGGELSAAAHAQESENRELNRSRSRRAHGDIDIEIGAASAEPSGKVMMAHSRPAGGAADDEEETDGSRVERGARVALVHGINRPFFHLDLTSALQSAVLNLEATAAGGLVEVDVVADAAVAAKDAAGLAGGKEDEVVVVERKGRRS